MKKHKLILHPGGMSAREQFLTGLAWLAVVIISGFMPN